MENFELLAQKISDLEKRVAVLESAGKASVSKPAASSVATSKTISAKEFLLTKKASGNTQKTLVLAYYLEFIESMSSFTVADLERVFRLAKEPVPGNLNDKINKNIAKGYITEAKEKKEKKKAWYLTVTGEKAVEELN